MLILKFSTSWVPVSLKMQISWYRNMPQFQWKIHSDFKNHNHNFDVEIEKIEIYDESNFNIKIFFKLINFSWFHDPLGITKLGQCWVGSAICSALNVLKYKKKEICNISEYLKLSHMEELHINYDILPWINQSQAAELMYIFLLNFINM